MQPGNVLLKTLVVSLFFLSACAPFRAPRKERVPPSPETTRALERFEQAEDFSQKQAYPEALAIYQDYLRRFPKGPLADMAIMKTGLLYTAAGNFPQARKAFQSLLSRYRKSPFVEDARFNVILTYYKEGDYSLAVKRARSFLEVAKTRDQEFRIHNLLGYCYSAGRQFKEAVRSYMDAYELSSQKERAEILSKVKEVITYLKEPELNFLLGIYGDRIPGGYLRLQLAKEYAAEDRIEPAMAVLSDFVSLFPDHDGLETATALIEELDSRSIVDRFLIGCILPLTGPYGTFGNRALTGIELALDLFNAQPHVHPVRLLIRDSKGDPNEAVMALETLVLKSGVAGIIGPMITSEPAAIKAQALKVPIMTLTQKSNITEMGDYVFRNFLTLSLQVKAIVDYAVRDLGFEKFAIFYPDERYGISFMNGFWDELILNGAEVVGIESYAPDQTDFSDAVKRLVGLYYPRPEEPPEKDMGNELEPWDMFLAPQEEEETRWPDLDHPDEPSDDTTYDTTDQDEEPQQQQEEEEEEPQPIIDFQAIFIPDSFEKIGLITPQLLFHDVAGVLLLGTNLWHSDNLIKMARGYVQGAILPEGFFADSPSPEVQNFVRDYDEVFGRVPAYLEAQAYDAAWILFQAVNQPQVRSRRTLKMALMEVNDFQGVTGLTSFDETGDAQKNLYLLTVEGSRFVQIRP